MPLLNHGICKACLLKQWRAADEATASRTCNALQLYIHSKSFKCKAQLTRMSTKASQAFARLKDSYYCAYTHCSFHMPNLQLLGLLIHACCVEDCNGACSMCHLASRQGARLGYVKCSIFPRHTVLLIFSRHTVFTSWCADTECAPCFLYSSEHI